jgi:hypothetical protein
MNLYQARVKEGNLRDAIMSNRRLYNGLCCEAVSITCAPVNVNDYDVFVALNNNAGTILADVFLSLPVC